MPLFFFDIDDGIVVRDEHGMECRDLEHVRERAKRLLPEIVLDELPRLPDDQKCFIVTVRNQDDIVVYRASLEFTGVLTES